MSDAENLRATLRLVVGDTDMDWEITSAPATEYEQGATVVQYGAGTSQETIMIIHDLITRTLESILCE